MCHESTSVALPEVIGVPPTLDWDAWVDGYSLVRDAIERTWPDQFKNFNKRLFQPGGFPRPLGARERKWNTPTGKANFTVPESLSNRVPEPPDVYQLVTLRSDGQFNTTIYGVDDRFRGVFGGREVVLINPIDMKRLDLVEGDIVRLVTALDDGVRRELGGLQAMSFDIPEKCIGSDYPECNVLIPVSHYAKASKVPAAKSVPVRIEKDRLRLAAE